MKQVVVLHNIRSAYNVGSIFRTADAAGVSKIYLTGYTPTPTDRFGRPQKEIAKTALGAENDIEWEYYKNIRKIIEKLRKGNYKIIGVEQDERACNYRTLQLSGNTAFVFGNEVRGLSWRARAHCDELIEIPMRGKKESLNVSVAVGVILFSV